MFTALRKIVSSSLALSIFAALAAQGQEPAAPAAPAPSPAPPAAAVPAAPPAVEQPPVPPAPVAPAPLDPKVLKQLETLLNQKFSRDQNDIFHSIERAGTGDLATFSASDRFLHYFRTGDWAKLRTELAAMPPELATRIYNKMLADLTEKQKPNARLEDVLLLGDAAPGDLTREQVQRLGQLLGLVVPANESFWISDRLKRGTEKLGGDDPAKRLLAGRVLLAGGFKDLARAWLPPVDQLQSVQDEGLRGELAGFLTTQEESDAVRRGQVQQVWNDNLRILMNTKVNDWERQKAGQAMSKVIAQVPPSTLAPVVADMVKTSPDAAVRLLSGLGRKLQNERGGDIPGRLENLKAQSSLGNLIADMVDAGTPPWRQLFDLMADAWAYEADNTFTQKTAATGGQPKYIAPEELLAAAPGAKWTAALSQGVRDRVDVSLSRTILAGANFDQAADRIVEIGKRSREAGVALAEDFLAAWAKTNNPQLPEALRKKYELPENARIPVTPIMMEKNVTSLARMMALFQAAGIAPRDYEKVVGAFDLAYSSAEAYRPAHIENVFGPLEKMDEPLFFLILSRMNANLGDRWRKMDVQRAGLTRRDETQTLEMVRAGYSTALQMIETWLAGHPGGARALTLAGTLLTDWGDFEYFQELVAMEPRKRMTGYKEKNLQAQDYFKRGAEAYGATVAKLAPADYSIDAYLGWFHGLLGIGSGGQLNLSKAMNRAALTRIREYVLALPDKAASAHMNLLSRALNTRLADEKDPLHEDLKYRYLASSLIITKDDPFSFGAAKKVAYFDELLSEIRLQTRVDGPSIIGREQDFGIVLSVIHTEAMGRVAQFGQYLTNEGGAVAGKPKKQAPLARKMRDAQGPRDELELSLTETLSPFFDIRSITFASPDVKPRPAQQPGWEETVLAYVLVRAKDASVDRIPPVELELKFVDLTGPVTIPAESAESLIKIATDTPPPRPATKVEITQTLDTRQFLINGALPLEIKATASGLVPELDQLLDLESLKKVVAVKNVNPHEGLQIKELNTWGEQVSPTSERLWTLALDGDPIRAADGQTEFRFPASKVKDATVLHQTYEEMNLTTLPQPVVTIGRRNAAGTLAARPGDQRVGWLVAAGLAAALTGGAFYLWRKSRTAGKGEHKSAGEVFHMPHEVDGFSVVALLRRLRTSPLVHLQEPQRAELQHDLQRVQQACFDTGSGAMSESELRGVAEKWLQVAR